MTVSTIPKPDADRPTVVVRTTDATDTTRAYRIELGPEELDDGLVMGGRRIDDAVPDDDRVHGPSERAWDAARKRFREDGHEVHG